MKQLPDTIEICKRNRDGYPCLGVIHRLASSAFGNEPYCYQCGSRLPGVVYQKVLRS